MKLLPYKTNGLGCTPHPWSRTFCVRPTSYFPISPTTDPCFIPRDSVCRFPNASSNNLICEFRRTKQSAMIHPFYRQSRHAFFMWVSGFLRCGGSEGRYALCVVCCCCCSYNDNEFNIRFNISYNRYILVKSTGWNFQI